MGFKERCVPDTQPASGYTVPFSGRATARDIFYCFRLLLGRYPHPEEWRGHAMRAGEDLNGVVTSFANSLECAQRGFVRSSVRTGDPAISPIMSELEGFVLFSDPEDASVGRAVRAGSYEPEICLQFRRLLSPGMCVLDIGANIGFFAMLSACLVGPSGHVVAVEPNPRNIRLLESSRRMNGFSNMTVLQVAAGRANGLLALNTSYSNGTTASLPSDVAEILGAETVPSIRLDALLLEVGKVDLIKIDVEGAEYPALQGCENVIRRHRPTIISEFSPGLMPGIAGIDGPGYLCWLVGLGYSLSVICPDGTLLEASTDILRVMAAYEASRTDHIDIVATRE
jgi:FkbM family methyltransferase